MSMYKSINFEEALAAHAKTKACLTALVDLGVEEGHPIDALGRDDLCDLGKWIIYGDAVEFQQLASYWELVKAYSTFYVQVVKVIGRIERGDRIGARATLNGKFLDASKETVKAIIDLELEVLRNQYSNCPVVAPSLVLECPVS